MTERLPTDAAASIDTLLEPGELLLRSVTTLAGTFALTDRRVVILRQGRSYRPATGVRSWGLCPANVVNYGPLRGGVGRLMVGSGKGVTSFFVKECDWPAALEIVSMAHHITYLATTKGWAGRSPTAA